MGWHMRRKYFLAFLDALLMALRTTGALLLGNAALVYHGVIGQPQQFLRVGLIGAIILIIVSVPWVALLKPDKEN